MNYLTFEQIDKIVDAYRDKHKAGTCTSGIYLVLTKADEAEKKDFRLKQMMWNGHKLYVVSSEQTDDFKKVAVLFDSRQDVDFGRLSEYFLFKLGYSKIAPTPVLGLEDTLTRIRRSKKKDKS